MQALRATWILATAAATSLLAVMAAACGGADAGAESSPGNGDGGASGGDGDTTTPGADAAGANNGDSSTDGQPDTGPSPCNLKADFLPAKAFDAVNTDSDEVGLRFTFDGTTALFGRGSSASNTFDIWIATSVHSFTNASQLAGVSAVCCNDSSASFSSDGLEAIFHSNDTVPAAGAPGLRIWRATRTSTTQDFSGRTPIAALTNTLGYAPWLTADGSSIYFTDYFANKIRRSVRISGGQFGSPDEIVVDGTYAVVTSDELTLYVARSTDTINFDIWMASRAKKNETWANIHAVPSLNTTFVELPTWVSPDGCRIAMTSTRPHPTGLKGSNVWIAEKPK